MNPIDMLKNDHARVKAMLNELDQRDGDERDRLLADIERSVKIHSQLEEEFIYPEFRDASQGTRDRKMFFEANEEHHVVDMVLPELKSVSSDSERFAARAKVLRELIEHHVEEEETEMLPRLQELVGQPRLAELARQMTERRLELEEQWSSPVGKAMHKAKSLADKVMPAAVKEHRDERR